MSYYKELMGETVASGLVWAESPRWRDGVLWVSDTQTSRLLAVGEAETEVYDLDSPVNGTSFLAKGQLVAARMTAKRIDLMTGDGWESYVDLSGVAEGRLGDMTSLGDGTIYVDDLGATVGPEGGRIVKVDPTRRPTVAATDLVFPNGLALIDGGETLIVAETFANRLTAFTVGSNGDLSARRPWLDLASELGPEHRADGLWASRDGSVWAATATGEAVIRAREGEIVEKYDMDGFAIACCLDDDEQSLYVTTARSNDSSQPVLEAVFQKEVTARVERYHCRDGRLVSAEESEDRHER